MKSKKEIWEEIHEEFNEAKEKAGIGDIYFPEDDNFNLFDIFEKIYADHEAELKEAIERENNPAKSL